MFDSKNRKYMYQIVELTASLLEYKNHNLSQLDSSKKKCSNNAGERSIIFYL